MLAYIKGTLEIKMSDYVVIDVGGLGYKINMSGASIDKIGNIGDTVKVHTYYRVREDDISIFGFNSNEELRMFELLLSVSGIGAKSSLTILSNISPSSFALAVISNDIGKLKKLPGIGPKTAQRIILELKDKLKTEEAIDDNVEELKEAIVENDKVSEAISALQVLGYSRREIDLALENIDKNNLSIEEIIRQGLKKLSK